MKNKSEFAKELIITLLVASLLSSSVTLIFSFTLVNLGVSGNSIGYVANIGATIWGLFVGYKINTLLREYG
jgi:putative Mn2+ efflux pump MntP